MTAKNKVSFIATVLNEEDTVGDLLKSLFDQTQKPDEVIIVDGGSTDKTLSVISNFQYAIRNKANLKLIIKKGNRAVGRNEAIKNAGGEIIAMSDAGCILDKNWLKNLVNPFAEPKVDVVAGFYRARTKSLFEECLAPYVLVMPDKANPRTFLPASRSMAMRKKVWEKMDGFPENFSHNEDYVFAQRLRKRGIQTVFIKAAICYFRPRKNLKEAFIMFYRFAYGDAEAGIFRGKVLLILARYLIALVLVVLGLKYNLRYLILALIALTVFYAGWSIFKNYRYVNKIKAIIILPVIQIISDLSVLSGTTLGTFKNLWAIRFKQ